MPDTSIPQPPPPNPLSDNSSRYYNVDMVYKTCVRAFDDLVEQIGVENMPTINPPFLSWDCGNNVAIINADKAGYATGKKIINMFSNN